MPKPSTYWKAWSDACFSGSMLGVLIAAILAILAITTETFRWWTPAVTMLVAGALFAGSWLFYRMQQRAVRWAFEEFGGRPWR